MLLLWGWGSSSLLPAAFSAGSPWRCTPSCKSDASLSSCPWGLSQLCLGACHCVGGSPVSLATMWACPGSHSLGSVGSYSELSCAHPPTPSRRLWATAVPHSRPPSRNPLADPCVPEHGGEGLAWPASAGRGPGVTTVLFLGDRTPVRSERAGGWPMLGQGLCLWWFWGRPCCLLSRQGPQVCWPWSELQSRDWELKGDTAEALRERV